MVDATLSGLLPLLATAAAAPARAARIFWSVPALLGADAAVEAGWTALMLWDGDAAAEEPKGLRAVTEWPRDGVSAWEGSPAPLWTLLALLMLLGAATKLPA